MHVRHLTSVDGDVVFDVDPDVAGPAAGPTRLADEVTVDEVALLARSATYTRAVFEVREVGAAGGIRPRLLVSRPETMSAYVDEIGSLFPDGAFATGPDVGTTPDDFARLGPAPVVTDDEAVARSVVAAAGAWLGDLDRRTVAVEGFGRAGSAVARELAARGARVVAVSTVRGSVADGRGLDVDGLVAARDEHGDGFVHHLDLDVHLPRELHELPVDVLVSGARTGVYTADVAARVQASAVVPLAVAPYTTAGLDVLRRAGVACLPDFVCNAGPVLAGSGPRGLPAAEVLDRIDRLVHERIDAARLAKMDPIDHAALLAETFLSTWVPTDEVPDGPPLA